MTAIAVGRKIPVSEVYGPVIQGEGAVIGTPTVFVRLGGCDYHCSWCDSLYAVEVKYKDSWIQMTASEILERIDELTVKPILVTLSGGNPALHRLADLIVAGQERGHHFAIETQGSVIPSWAARLDHITLSPKPPSSKMVTNWKWLERWMQIAYDNAVERCAKVVVFDENDYSYAAQVRNLALSYHCPVYLQAGTSNPYSDTNSYEERSKFREAILERTDWLSQRVIADGWYDVRVLPQMHALIYGAKRGV